ncbi:hypothetical protein [Bradyrhizobium sp. Ai1a-2]|uniref:hypothetical protein n=1 Tax=Bradyrhizobium sp. Ai1a-2 TaxID=196490 RepID=UPI001363EF3C|nr:hypothetical protein [Bradyrhizobium sp. Ai1a-2]
MTAVKQAGAELCSSATQGVRACARRYIALQQRGTHADEDKITDDQDQSEVTQAWNRANGLKPAFDGGRF